MGTHDTHDAEASLLGALLVDDSVWGKVEDLVVAEDFVTPMHSAIFTAYQHLRESAPTVDTITLHAALKGTVGLDYLVTLSSTVSSGLHAPAHARIVHEAALRRRVAGLGTKISAAVKSGENDASSVLERAEKAIASLTDQQPQQAISSVAEVLEQTMTRIEQAEQGLVSMGLSTGYDDMDAILTGLQPSDLIILAARPSMGKTAFALNLARNAAAKSEAPVLVFSLEMSKGQLVDRLLSMETGVSTERLRTGLLGDSETAAVTAGMGALSELPIYIDDTAGITVAKVRQKARRQASTRGLELIIVDYLQLMSGGKMGKNTNRVEEMSEISRGLKSIARELNVPVIALSQLSRNVESRDVKIPQLSDLRDSGSIEQDADIVAFLYRDDYYSPDTLRRNMTDVLIRKHRNGRIGSVELYFDRNMQRFRGITT